MMNKRDLVLSLLDRNKKAEYIPAAFFLHFDQVYHRGQAAVDKHLEYSRYTGMDFVKIQFEHNFPFKPERPDDWVRMPLYKKDFYKDDLEVVDGLVKRAKKESLVIMTLYSPYMCARFASEEKITEHIRENPEKAKKGMEILTESLMIFVKECVSLGIDGFIIPHREGKAISSVVVLCSRNALNPMTLSSWKRLTNPVFSISCISAIFMACTTI